MPYNRIRKAYTGKPPSGVKPNLGHPQLNGCVNFWPMNEGAGLKCHDVIRGNNLTLNESASGAVEWRNFIDNHGRPTGISPYYTTNSNNNGMDLDNVVSFSGNCTFIFQAHHRALSNGTPFFGSEGNNCNYRQSSFGSYVETLFYDDDNNLDKLNPSYNSAPAAGNTHQIALVVNSDNAQVYSDLYEGEKETGGNMTTASISRWAHSDSFSSAAGYISIFWARLYDRALSAREIFDIYQNPWIAFSRPLPIWIPSGAAPPAWNNTMNEINAPGAVNEITNANIQSVNEI